MMVCPNCGRNVTDDSMQFCPACGFSFNQQPNQTYAQYQHGPQPYGYPAPPRKSVAIAVLLSLFIPGLGQLYVKKVKRGVSLIVTFIVLYAISSVITSEIAKNIDFTDRASVNNVITNPAFVVISLVTFGFWLFGMYDAYRMARKYDEAANHNDLARFQKEF